MTARIPRTLAAYKKLDLFEKRLGHLRGVVSRKESAPRITESAEKLRLAGLAIVKARRSQLDGQRPSDELTRQLQNLDCDEQRWLTLTVDEIVQQFTAVPSDR